MIKIADLCFKIVNSSLDPTGRPSIQPFPTPIISSITLLTTAFAPANTPTRASGIWSTGDTKASYTTRSGVSVAYDHSANQVSTTSVNSTHVRRGAIAAHRKYQLHRRHHKMEKRASTDCFQLPTSGQLPRQITARSDHPAPKIGIVSQEPHSSIFN